ncbi:hypothetical protein GCM10028817_32860 [Spirosoma pomorum]
MTNAALPVATTRHKKAVTQQATAFSFSQLTQLIMTHSDQSFSAGAQPERSLHPIIEQVKGLVIGDDLRG